MLASSRLSLCTRARAWWTSDLRRSGSYLVLEVELVEFTGKVREKIIFGPNKNEYCNILQKQEKIFYKNQFATKYLSNKLGNVKIGHID